MRSRKITLVTFLSLLLTLFASQLTVRADDDSVPDDYDEGARVVRVSFIQGDVRIKRHDSDDWETAQLNAPLVEGDTLATAGDARAEIQIDAQNFLRVAADSEVQMITLRSEGIALSLAEGSATLRLARFDKDHEYFEIDAPKTTVAAERQGVYRIDVAANGGIHVTVREDGLARVYSDTAGFTVKGGRGANLSSDGDQAGEWQMVAALANDSWDTWVSEREQTLAPSLKTDQTARHYDADVWGAEDLDNYGSWEQSNDYGWVWRPSATVINSYDDWTPYRYGSWVWCAPYGWTWVGSEPWGWAPYHFGRWVYYNNYWAWCPHSYFPHQRSWWRPALVVFVSIDFSLGNHVCWYPLSYRQRDPRSNYFRAPGHVWHGSDIAHINPAYRRAVTALPTREFGNHRTRPRPADGEVARRVFGTQPIRGELPVRHNNNGGGRASAGGPGTTVPGTHESHRQTGAAPRTPGVRLDNDLRRRVFNGHDPITPTPNGGSNKSRPTGGVMRPSVPVDPRANRGGPPAPTQSPDPRAEHRDRRPPPMPPPSPGPAQPTPPAPTSTPVRPADKRERPDRTEHSPGTPDGGRPRTQLPPRSEQPPPRPTPAPERTAPPRSNPPPQHTEPPARSTPPPRSDPPPQHTEPPARSTPPPRSDPPPQHTEPPARSTPPPRSDPPPRPAPPPQRTEPPAKVTPPQQQSEPPAKTREERPNHPEKKRDN